MLITMMSSWTKPQNSFLAVSAQGHNGIVTDPPDKGCSFRRFIRGFHRQPGRARVRIGVMEFSSSTFQRWLCLERRSPVADTMPIFHRDRRISSKEACAALIWSARISRMLKPHRSGWNTRRYFRKFCAVKKRGNWRSCRSTRTSHI